MIDEKLSILLDKLLETSIEFLKENGYDNVEKICFKADGLKWGMCFGKNCPEIDNYLAIYDASGNKIGEYM